MERKGSLSRRDFLKVTPILIMAAAFGGCDPDGNGDVNVGDAVKSPDSFNASSDQGCVTQNPVEIATGTGPSYCSDVQIQQGEGLIVTDKIMRGQKCEVMSLKDGQTGWTECEQISGSGE